MVTVTHCTGMLRCMVVNATVTGWVTVDTGTDRAFTGDREGVPL